MATLHSSVLDELGMRIVEGDLAPDTVITLEWLGEEFSVSRTVAREVVQVLVSVGLVESRRRTGVRVLPPDSWAVFDQAVIRWRLAGRGRDELVRQLSELRVAVEPAAAALAAHHASPEQRRRLVELAHAMEGTGVAGDLRGFLEQDVAFHRLVLVASGNLMYAGLAEVVEAVLRGRTDHRLMPHEPKPEARRLHLMVADAVEHGQPDVARAAMSAICVEVLAEMSPGSA